MIEGVVLQLLMEKEVGVSFSGPLEKCVYKTSKSILSTTKIVSTAFKTICVFNIDLK